MEMEREISSIILLNLGVVFIIIGECIFNIKHSKLNVFMGVLSFFCGCCIILSVAAIWI